MNLSDLAYTVLLHTTLEFSSLSRVTINFSQAFPNPRGLRKIKE